MNESVLADIDVTCAGATTPSVRLSISDRILKVVEARIILLLERLHQAIDSALFILQRLQLSAAVMDDAYCRSEAKLESTRSDFHCVMRIVDAATDHGINVDVKERVLGQQLEFLIENLEAFLRDVVRHHVIDRDLQVIESGFVQPVDALCREQISVR